MDDDTALRPPAPEPARWGLGRVLRLATGVREDIMAHVPSERARYTSMGGVVAGTAVMAMLSMATALYWVFGGFQAFIPVAVVVWGIFIFSLDRWLMSSTTVGDTGKVWRKLLPRLVLSIALGVILAEPLLLAVYNTAITERIAKDRQQELTVRESNLRICNPIPGTEEATKPAANEDRCNSFRLSFGGDSPAALQSELVELSKQATALKAIVDADAKKYAELQQLARQECNGDSGSGLTGRPGVGFNCNRLRNEADQYRADHKIDENAKKLSDLNTRITALTNQLGTARNGYNTLINDAIEKDLAEVRGRQGRVGILERFRALDHLVSENAYVHVTLWAIRLFFIIVDALPVILKVLNGNTSYDRLLESKLSEQEEIQRMRSGETLDRSAQWGDVVRHERDLQRRIELERIDEADRIERANYDERRDELIDALATHLMRTAIGPVSRGWSPSDDGRIVDMDPLSDIPTREFTRPDMPGGTR
jgi:hypothetical protein